MTHNDLLGRVSEFIASVMGLHFPESRWPDLERGLQSAAREFGFQDAGALIPWLMSSPLTREHIERLASHLTVGETYFFRDQIYFDLLESEVLRGLISARGGSERRLRIWSAGCSTGEEPYSIAILLSRMIPDIKDWSITLLATDINANAIKKARKGIYSKWSFRGTPAWVREGYFKKGNDGRYELLPRIREMVTFGYLNLAEDLFPSLLTNTTVMDIILSRNVLMYFSEGDSRRVIQRFYHSLTDGGWLLVSPVEAVHYMFQQFVPVNFPDVVLYQKSSRLRPEPLPALSPPLPVLPPLRTLHEEVPVMFDQARSAEAGDRLAVSSLPSQKSPESALLLARACANEGSLDDAAAQCQKVIDADVLNPSCHYLLATILIEQGRVQEAVRSLQRVLYIDPTCVLAYFLLGNIMMQGGDAAASEKYLRNASELLSAYKEDFEIPESEGMTAGRLLEMINVMVR